MFSSKGFLDGYILLLRDHRSEAQILETPTALLQSDGNVENGPVEVDLEVSLLTLRRPGSIALRHVSD